MWKFTDPYDPIPLKSVPVNGWFTIEFFAHSEVRYRCLYQKKKTIEDEVYCICYGSQSDMGNPELEVRDKNELVSPVKLNSLTLKISISQG